jgi:hypothetical protein
MMGKLEIEQPPGAAEKLPMQAYMKPENSGTPPIRKKFGSG